MKKLIILLICTAVCLTAVNMFTDCSAYAGAAAADTDVLSNKNAKIDISDAELGYIKITYTGGGSGRVKVLITGVNKIQYNYDLNNKGESETFPLSEGDGKYKVDVCTNISGTKYAFAFSASFDVKLENEYVPFLAPNQYVNYTDDSDTVKLAEKITADDGNDLEKTQSIYDYVVLNFTYDSRKAKDITDGKIKGYIPDVDSILSSNTGICFDYASVAASMLRSVEVPCRLIVGYAGGASHAWIDVFSKTDGTIAETIVFDGSNWTRMDPTFASSAKQSKSIMRYIGDGSNYKPKFRY